MISDETLQEEVSQTVKEYGEKFQDFTESVHPWRIALSGLLLLLFIGGIFATWYWVIPRDSVTVETVYLQRSGHVMLVEVHNEGSRPITSVELSLQFLDNESDVLDSIVVNIDTIPAHTSVSGDDLGTCHAWLFNLGRKFHPNRLGLGGLFGSSTLSKLEP